MSDILSAIAVPFIAFALIFAVIFLLGWITQQDTAGTWYDIAMGFGGATPNPTSTPPATSTAPPALPDSTAPVAVMNAYSGKLIYTLETSRAPSPYKSHCRAAGGRFNTCGTPCEPGAAACVQVCAFTCEL